jgi:hypothetical protein
MTGTIEERGSIPFGSSRGMAGKLASEMIGEGIIEQLMAAKLLSPPALQPHLGPEPLTGLRPVDYGGRSSAQNLPQ